MGFLGYRQSAEDERGFDFDLKTEHGFCSIGIVKAKAGTPDHHRYAPGLHHVAWTADSREDVDRLHARRRAEPS